MVTKVGTAGDDTLTGGSFKDKFWGKAGDDVLKGNGGNDILKGQAGDDKLVGGKGNDKLDGGTGNDKLTGGDGHDTFIFGTHSGKDVITDFDVKKDVLQIAHGVAGIKKPADVLDHASQHGKNVVIDLGHGNKITLKGVDLGDLKKHPGDHFDIS
jgi:Ca2+-binding RTX toxin-like protein